MNRKENPAQPMSDAIADTADELAREGVHTDTISATALASACALIHVQHGPEGLAERLRAFLDELEPMTRPARGRE